VRNNEFSRLGLTGRICILVSLATLSACGTAKPPLLKITVSADEASNPDLKGRASPVVVRVFELKSLAGFNSADYFSLYDKESEILGADLIGKEELHLKPGESINLSHPLGAVARASDLLGRKRRIDGVCVVSPWLQSLDHAEGANTEGSARSITVTLTEEETEALLRKVPEAYQTQINDVLLTAFTQAMSEWTGSTRRSAGTSASTAGVSLNSVNFIVSPGNPGQKGIINQRAEVKKEEEWLRRS